MIKMRSNRDREHYLRLESLLLYLSFYGKKDEKEQLRAFFQSVEEGAASSDILNRLYLKFGFEVEAFDDKMSEIRSLLLERKIGYISVLDEAYPALLREIKTYPLGLFYRGNLELLSYPCVSVVGSRRATYDAGKMCDLLAKHFLKKKIAVVSGLAFGVDALVHKSCLHREVKTIAILPSSVDEPIPVSNLNIAESIIKKGGLLLSENPPGYRVHASSYVERNRIISGISDRTLIVEAALRSGSMSTASFAIEQDRDLYVMPGSISNPVAEGCNYLIAQGAKVLYRAEDFYEFSSEETEEFFEQTEQDRMEELLFGLLKERGKMDLDEVLTKLKMEKEEILAKLIELELMGLIRRSNQFLELL